MKKQIFLSIILLFLLVGGIVYSSTITTIQTTDTIGEWRVIDNTNFLNLNTD